MDDLLEVQAVGGVRLAADAPHAQLVGRALEESLSGAQCKVEVLAKGAEGDVVGLNGAHIGAGQVVAPAGGHGLVLQLAVVGVLAEILFHVMRRQGALSFGLSPMLRRRLCRRLCSSWCSSWTSS